MDVINDLGALARARAGHADEFCRLMEPRQSRLLRQAAALSGDLNVADDLVAETMVEAWKSLARYDETCRLSTWLYAILLHRWQKWKRRARSRPVALASLPVFEHAHLVERQENVASSELTPDEQTARHEQSILMRQRIERLPEKHRQVILLRFYEDASLPDMAKVMGCPVGTVKSRLHHALENLRAIKMNVPATGEDTHI